MVFGRQDHAESTRNLHDSHRNVEMVSSTSVELSITVTSSIGKPSLPLVNRSCNSNHTVPVNVRRLGKNGHADLRTI